MTKITHTITLPDDDPIDALADVCAGAESATFRIVAKPNASLGWGYIADVTLAESDEIVLANVLFGNDLDGLRNDYYDTDRRQN